MRLACQRHLRDLTRQDTPDFPYHFDITLALGVATFFREFLTLDDGQPFVLMAWLQFVFGSLEGWVDATGTQRFQTAYVETGKGSAKTPAAAGYGVYGLVGKGEQSAEIYSLGVTGDQARYLYKYAKQMSERSDELSDILDIGEHNIAWVEMNSFLRPLSSEGRSLDNKRPYLALVDELHEHPSSVIPEKMRLGFKGRRNALLFEITNAGFDKTSVCWEHHAYSMQVLEGSLSGASADRWFAYICQLDPCEACRADGLTQPKDGCKTCDAWTDPAVWLKVNPSLGVTITVDQMRAVVEEAINRPGLQARVKRLYCCMWTQAHTIWIQADRWDSCRVATVPERAAAQSCAFAFDMSTKFDLTSGVAALRVEDEPGATVDVIELKENDGGSTIIKTLNLNFTVDLVTFFWLPEDTLRDRAEHEHIPYDQWHRDGFLRVTPGPIIDYDQIYEEFKTDIGPRYRPQRVGYDPYNATQFAIQLRDKAKYTVVEVPQGRKLSESFKLFEALVRVKRIRHNGNPVMSFCVANAEPKYDRHENLWIEKPSPAKRIDGLIAGVMALNQLVLLPPKRGKRKKAQVWTPGAGFQAAVQEPEPTHA